MDATQNMKHKFAVLPHTHEHNGWYRAQDALGWYISKSAADKFCRAHRHLNCVVRPVSMLRDDIR